LPGVPPAAAAAVEIEALEARVLDMAAVASSLLFQTVVGTEQKRSEAKCGKRFERFVDSIDRLINKKTSSTGNAMLNSGRRSKLR
jgi:hypothetical protein